MKAPGFIPAPTHASDAAHTPSFSVLIHILNLLYMTSRLPVYRTMLLAAWLASAAAAWAQPADPHEKCGTMELLDRHLSADPSLAQRLAQVERFAQTYQTQGSRTTAIITIPVVVHVVYNTPVENVSDAQVFSQIDVLNEDFRRLNADTTNTPLAFQPVAADYEIEFCLANVDPNGYPTTGITRTATSVTTFGFNDEVKFAASGGIDAWPTGDYLNIWVCDLGGGLLGYAQFPGDDPLTDGVVINYEAFGRMGTASAPYHRGRTTTHEVGHWLDLRHVWGDGPCGVDDGVADTPLSDGPNYGCSIGHVSCGSVDMVQNYMDYSDDVCCNLFTQGQKTRSMALFAPGGARESLLYSGGCCSQTSCPLVAGLTLDSFDDSSVALQWAASDSQATYTVRYRVLGDTAWTTAPATADTTLLLSGLDFCTTYEVAIASACSADTNTFCANYQVKTLGCCEAPQSLNTVLSAANFVLLNWERSYGVQSFEIRYRQLGSTAWSLVTTNDTSYLFAGLEQCAAYEYQVRALCNKNSQDFTPVAVFYTRGCEDCLDAAYCQPRGSANLTWINRFQLGNTAWTSASDGGYGLFANFSQPVYIDSTYAIALERGGSVSPVQQWKVWIDANRDGAFDETTELLYESGTVNTATVSDVLTIPDTLAAGYTRLRVATRFVGFGAPATFLPCDTVGSGEYEDYCVNLRNICRSPEAFAAVRDSVTGDVQTSWLAYPYADAYFLRYQKLGDSLWTEITTTASGYVLPAALLDPCSTYLLQVRSSCVPDSSTRSGIDTVVTACATGLPELAAGTVRLYPNPGAGSLTLEAPTPILRLRIYDMPGRLVLDQRHDDPTVHVRTQGVQAGIYLVEVTTTQGRAVQRWVCLGD
ncbi:MAG: hypothetical protein OHK0039_43530 [Bacteroidia bacterium]